MYIYMFEPCCFAATITIFVLLGYKINYYDTSPA